jgi:hypothetical protein
VPFVTVIFENYQRSEAALLSAMLEMAHRSSLMREGGRDSIYQQQGNERKEGETQIF